jgi:ABC-type antimicrobial peptide transport system permease subunit
VSSVSVEAALQPELRDPRFRSVLFGTFAAVALFLAAGSLYALASFEVALRRYEMGVRVTLGASSREIQRMVIGTAIKPVALGIVLGGAVALWSVGLLESFLYDVTPRDPWMLVAVSMALLGTASLAAWIPARRASRVDPLIVMRAE